MAQNQSGLNQIDLVTDDLKQEIADLTESKNWKQLKHELSRLEPFQVADLLEDTAEKDRIILFRLLDRNQSSDVFGVLSHSEQKSIVDAMAVNAGKITQLLNDLDPDDRTAFLEELPSAVAQRLIMQLSPENRTITNQLLGYPKDSIGRLMTTEFVAVRPDFTVAQAFDHIRRYGSDSETLNMIYVVDENWKLIDDLRIKELILASPGQKIADLINYQFIALNVKDDQEEAIRLFKDYSRVALPATDDDGILLGIVTFDDIMYVADDESREDFHKFNAIQNAIADPIRERIFSLYKNRVVWLVALVFMNVFSGAALASFEDIIQKVTHLVFFLPLLIDSGGNAGSQSATLMVRSLAMGDVKPSDWYRLIAKELVVSLLLGVTMAVGVALVASFRAPDIILVVASTMILTVMVGSVVGLLLPFIFTKFSLDPAAASAPLITTIADISGVVIYFSIASWYFGI